MALRLIEVFLPPKDEYRVQQALNDFKVLDIWQERFSKEFIHIKILITSEDTETVLDLLNKHISMVEGHRIILLPVVASLPRPEIVKEEMPDNGESQPENNSKAKKGRISREELYADVEEITSLSYVFVILSLLSSVVAAIGILQNNVAVIIGAMVIAPLLGPNVAFSLATTWGCRPGQTGPESQYNRYPHSHFICCCCRIYI